MTVFPDEPVSPREFIEDVIPALFAGLDLDAHAAALDIKIGVRLVGENGGDWTLHFIAGELGIAAELASDCAAIVRQSVVDWSALLWDGRPGLLADVLEQLKDANRGSWTMPGVLAAPRSLGELENISGRIDAIIEASDSEDAPDWCISIQLGPGPISNAADATLQIGASEAEALRCGALHPVEALITGQLRLEGDLGMIVQLQAIAMAMAVSPSQR